MKPVAFLSKLTPLALMLPIAWLATPHPAAAQARPRTTAPAPVSASPAPPPSSPSPSGSSSQIVDRIVATVGQQVITLSDARAAINLHLLPEVIAIAPTAVAPATGPAPASAPVRPPQPSSPAQPGSASGASGIAGTLDLADIVERLVERELMRAEIDRFGVMAPPPDVLESRVDAVRKRFANAAAFAAALDACGLSDARFRAWLMDDWRIEQYIQQRFEAAAQATDEDVLQYYQSRERDFVVADRPRPFTEVREEARTRLMASRRKALVDDWIAGLRRRADIVILLPREGA